MKTLIVAGAKIKYMPYLFNYFQALLDLKYDTTLFYWDRDSTPDRSLPKEVKVIRYTKEISDDIPKICKIPFFLDYRKSLISVLKSQDFDQIIVCDSQFAILISDILLNKFQKKYVFDYRDPSFENLIVYKKRLASIVHCSKATFISSDAYRKYLPECDHVYNVHNFLDEDLTQRNIRKNHPRNREKLSVSFWGCIRDLPVNMSLVKNLANDDRFELNYFGKTGKTGEEIIAYCKKNNIHNVKFHGEYLHEESYLFKSKTDLIHNMYDNNGCNNPSMGNKFYEGIIFYIPQICTYGGYMGKETIKNGVGISLDPFGSEKIADAIYRYYQNIDWQKFEKNCDICLERILKEQNYFKIVLRESLDKNGNCDK